MKNYAIIFLFILIPSIFCAQNEEVDLLIGDTAFMFEGDLKVWMYRHNKKRTIYVYNEDSTFLKKEYCDKTGTLLHAATYDKEGYYDGGVYTFDPLKKTVYHGVFSHSQVINSYTLDENLDTLGYVKQINDTAYQKMETRDSVVLKYECNQLFSPNGKFQILDKESKNLLAEGNFKTIKASEILDENLFSEKIKNQKKDHLLPFFKKSVSGNSLIETSFPTGTWHYYDKKGNLIKILEYDWSGVFMLKE